MARPPTWPPRPHPHKASGQDRVRWKGKDYYLGESGSAESRKNYVELVRRLEGEAAAAPPDRPTVSHVCDRWRVHAIETYGPDNHEAAEYAYLCRDVVALLGETPAAEIEVDHLEQLRDRMVANGLCRNVVNRRVVRFRTMWRWAERKKLAPKGSWAHLRSLPPLRKGERGARETKRVAPAEWRDVAAVCRRVTLSTRGLLLAQWFTGARPGELFPLRVKDLVRDGVLAAYRPERHKNAWRGQDRVVIFGPRALRVIAPNLAGKAPEDLVFENRFGEAHDRRSYGLAVSRAAKRAGVKLHAYQLRHAYRLRISRELGMEAARVGMGHQSVGTTAKYAAGVDEKAAADVARRMG